MRTRKAHLCRIRTKDSTYIVTSDGLNLLFRKPYSKTPIIVPLVDVLDRVRGHYFTVNNEQVEAKATEKGLSVGSRIIPWIDINDLINGQHLIA